MFPLTFTRYKPCSVLPAQEVAAIYLHIAMSRSSFRFNPPGSPTKFGFLACGVYPFHLHSFPCSSSLWHFYRSVSLVNHLRIASAVRLSPAWTYRLVQRKHYRHHRRCEHGLSSS